MGIVSGWQRKYFVVDPVNGFFAFSNTKNSLFSSPMLSETLPSCAIQEAILGEGREFHVNLKNGRKFHLRVERSDSAEQWVHAFAELANQGVKLNIEHKTSISSNYNAPQTENKAIRISFTVGDKIMTKDYNALFIGCDPLSLGQALKMTEAEKEVFHSQVRFTFHTSLLEVKADNLSKDERNGRIVPSIQRKMNGDVYAYRNETLKTLGADVKSDSLILTCYQILGTDLEKSDEEMRAQLEDNLKTFKWFPYKEWKLLETFHCAYFAHFRNEDLVRGLPWKLLEFQGKNRTMYIHGSACFESVLHIYQYHEMLFKRTRATKMLPVNKSAPIAILGAGPSGLMMAVRLARMGYSNIEILEVTDRYGGKSVTEYIDTPNGKVVCELGTCYLSADYKPFREYFAEFLTEEESLPDVVDRQVVTENELKYKQDLKAVDTFTNYALAKGMEENETLGFKNLTRADILYDFYRFAQLHDMIFHGEKPFPLQPPEALKGVFGKQTFYQFLQAHGLESLIGILQYAYQAQGYGSLETIPAFYGLVWITPNLLAATFRDSVGFTIDPNYKSDTITYIKNGWQSVWEKVMSTYNFPVRYNATVTKIERKE